MLVRSFVDEGQHRRQQRTKEQLVAAGCSKMRTRLLLLSLEATMSTGRLLQIGQRRPLAQAATIVGWKTYATVSTLSKKKKK